MKTERKRTTLAYLAQHCWTSNTRHRANRTSLIGLLIHTVPHNGAPTMHVKNKSTWSDFWSLSAAIQNKRMLAAGDCSLRFCRKIYRYVLPRVIAHTGVRAKGRNIINKGFECNCFNHKGS